MLRTRSFPGSLGVAVNSDSVSWPGTCLTGEGTGLAVTQLQLHPELRQGVSVPLLRSPLGGTR